VSTQVALKLGVTWTVPHYNLQHTAWKWKSSATLVSHFRTKVPDLKTDPRPELPRAAAGGDARG
jgi:hypothetical protein